MSYYLVYGASETERQRVAHRRMVNYYMDYRTSETNKAPSAGSTSVNYCLIYGTSETNGEVRTILQVVNYCLIYRTSETPRLKVKKRKQGELLPGLPYIRNLIPISREILSVNYCLVYGMCKSKYGFKATNCPLGRPVWGIFFCDFY